MIKLKEMFDEKFYDIVKNVGKDKGDWIDLTKYPVDDEIKNDFPIRKNIFDLVDFAYKTSLGEPHVGVRRPEDVVGNEYNYWKAVDINDNPDADAVLFGKRRYGIKISGVGHNGERMVKEELIKHILDILKKNGYWIEALHPVSSILKRGGAQIFTNKEKIQKIFPESEFTKWFNDGSYTRTIPNVKKDSNTKEYIFERPNI